MLRWHVPLHQARGRRGPADVVRGGSGWRSRASYRCLDANTGGQKGWRLPNITELTSLVDPSVTTEPTLPAGHPFDFDRHVFFWSGTIVQGFTDNFWGVNFRLGIIDDAEMEYNLSYLCVRGGPEVDVY